MQLFTPHEYIKIDLANNYGLDKLTYKERLDWFETNKDNLDSLVDSADDPWLYHEQLKRYKEVLKGKPTGYIVRFDAVSSGIQILSVLTRCINGCKATGAVNHEEDKRPNCYRDVEAVMNRLLGNQEEETYDYSSIKQVAMLS